MPNDNKIDPALVTIISNRIAAIAEEMARTLMMTSRSGIFAEARDFVTAILDKDGRLIAQSGYFPGFSCAMPPLISSLLEKYGRNIFEGDMFIENDPFEGNSHVPDMNIIKPVFYDGELQFFTACKGHMADIGGRGVAGYDPEGTTIWNEGLVLPHIKLHERGRRIDGIWELILRNVKIPEIVAGDIMCEIGGVNIGERRLLELLKRYGPETINLHIEEFLAASERDIRDKIERLLPDGVYYGEKSTDNDVEDRNKPVTVRVEVNVEGSEITIDFSKSDPQGPHYMNSSYGFTQSMAVLTLFWILGGVESNQGSYRPIHIINPGGTCVNPEFPATMTLATTSMAEAIQEAIQLALAPAIPQLIPTGISKLPSYIFSGFNPRTGRPYVIVEFFARCIPQGGTEGYDGWEQGGTAQELGMGRTPDPEIWELMYPIRIHAFEQITDTAGAGKFRGGMGHVYKVQYLADIDNGITMGNGMREWSIPSGLFGGKSPGLNELSVERADGRLDKLDNNMFVKIRAGDILTYHCMGGAGFGDPFERDLKRVPEDVINELLSIEKAREDYGVVIDPGTLQVDEQATQELRKGRKVE